MKETKEMRFKENNEVVERFELDAKKVQRSEECYRKQCVLNGRVNRDVIDYCYQWKGSYCKIDNSHNTHPLYCKSDGKRLIENSRGRKEERNEQE